MVPRGGPSRAALGRDLPLAGAAALLLLAFTCGGPRPQSNRSFDEIKQLVSGKTAAEVAAALGEPDSRKPTLLDDEKWIWWNYTYLDGNDYAPEVRGKVVHLVITFRAIDGAARGPRASLEWVIDEPFGVTYLARTEEARR